MKICSIFACLAATSLGFASPVERTIRSATYNGSAPRWDLAPNGGPLPGNPKGDYLTTTPGVKVWYTTFGDRNAKTTPIFIAHGGFVNTNSMFNQIAYLAKTRFVIAQDTRGHGRSPYTGFTEFHYDDIARDAIAVLDHLGVYKFAVLGWSDGAITALNLAMNYSARVDRIWANAANIQANQSLPGLKDPIINSATGSLTSDFDSNGTTYSINGLGLRKRNNDGADPYSYANLNPLPQNEEAFGTAMLTMWASEPTWGPAAFLKIKCPTWTVDGDHDALIQRNQQDAIAAWTPFAGQVILPQVGHYALLTDPEIYNFVACKFFDQAFDGVLPVY